MPESNHVHFENNSQPSESALRPVPRMPAPPEWNCSSRFLKSLAKSLTSVETLSAGRSARHAGKGATDDSDSQHRETKNSIAR